MSTIWIMSGNGNKPRIEKYAGPLTVVALERRMDEVSRAGLICIGLAVGETYETAAGYGVDSDGAVLCASVRRAERGIRCAWGAFRAAGGRVQA